MKETMDNTNIPIFLASNDNYAPFVATTMASICYNTKSFIEFYILDGGITNFRKKQIENLKEKFDNFLIEFIKIDFDRYFNNFNSNLYWTLDMYSRLLIPELKKNLDRAIYLDVDIIVLDDITKLFEQNLEDYIIGAIPENYSLKSINFRRKNLLLSEKHRYFNSGVLLIDCKKWRDKDVLNKILSLENNLRERLRCPDQDLLNKFFDNNYKMLDCKFNLLNGQICLKSEISEEIKNNVDIATRQAIIRHFEGLNKPWISSTNDLLEKTLYFNEFWFFAKMTNFYEGLLNNFIIRNLDEKLHIYKKKRITLFKILPFLTIKTKSNKSKFYLFGFIPLLTIKSK